mmetsp:Transcript_61970/g.145327  ORF Transcript_61970/g.145327 Transcript_61970/m.145327 type:complete len:217 (-) Transcript_61970:617-1267(-)
MASFQNSPAVPCRGFRPEATLLAEVRLEARRPRGTASSFLPSLSSRGLSRSSLASLASLASLPSLPSLASLALPSLGSLDFSLEPSERRSRAVLGSPESSSVPSGPFGHCGLALWGSVALPCPGISDVWAMSSMCEVAMPSRSRASTSTAPTAFIAPPRRFASCAWVCEQGCIPDENCPDRPGCPDLDAARASPGLTSLLASSTSSCPCLVPLRSG